MAEQDDPLVQKLLGMTRADVLEAALAFGDHLGVEGAQGSATDEFVAELEAEPHVAVEDVEQLARTALIAAALDEQTRESLAEILDRVGERAFIFGGAEIVAAGVIAIGLLQTALAKGRTGEEKTVEVRLDEHGQPQMTIKCKTTFGLSARVGGVLSSILRHPGG
jgi:hypothetical protein